MLSTIFISKSTKIKLIIIFCICFFAKTIYANTNKFISKDLVKQYAPLVYLHHEEEFRPSSVEYFFNYINKDFAQNYLNTKDELECASCTNLSFLSGQSVSYDNVPIYTMVVPKPNIGKDITDVFYFMFYPYNRGKRVCISPVYINGSCWGKYSTFGHHIGDWEHITIRFEKDVPKQIYLSQHDFGESFDWESNDIELKGMHPVLFSAKGSHGTYASAENHVYRKIFNGDKLVDETSMGEAWHTWNNIVAINQNDNNLDWVNYSGRWGNSKRQCTFLGIDFENIFGSCVLNSGPTGPAFKSPTNVNQDCLYDEFLENKTDAEKKEFCR